MKIRLCIPLGVYFIPYITFLVFQSCDNFEEDSIIPNEPVEYVVSKYYIKPGTSALIDLKSIVKRSFVNATLKISTKPSLGTLTHLDSTIFKYQPSTTFISGSDRFDVSVMNEDEEISRVTIKIMVLKPTDEFPCQVYAFSDITMSRPGMPVVVHFRENDRICGVNSSNLIISVNYNQNKGDVQIIGDSLIIYTPGQEFQQKEELIYKISDPVSGSLSYALITVLDSRTTQEVSMPSFSRPSTYFLNEVTGFVSGQEGTFKTSNGGLSWKRVNERPLSNFIFIDSLYAYANFGSIMATTNDGGNTWQMMNVMEYYLQTFDFISHTTGCAGVTTPNQGDEFIYGKILKTEDGGISWREVLSLQNHYVQKLHFINSDEGYGSLYEYTPDPMNYYGDYDLIGYKIFITRDGGETWNILIEDKFNGTNYNSNFYSFWMESSTDFYTIMRNPNTFNASVFESVDAVNWEPIGDLPFNFSGITFSPTRRTGVITSNNGQIHIIKKEDDVYHTQLMPNLNSPYMDLYSVAMPSDKIAYIYWENKFVRYVIPD